ncbi:hypothetical protein [Paenibacillus sp. OV219]|uniref:hypothetical protein n=1 Tax=Paenibacillus sp. OV219 TaxID=1884377 RepID=UPI0008C9EB33|nr:hypothetical protein [Paenibacillus sp. OV219]SEN27241.1 hypothetical protein SAMN05518847_102564 [Paenibacillus sp. OV219]
MKIRLMPAVLTAVISASVLVGGWFTYHSVAAVKPLERIVAGTPGVIESTPVINRNTVTIDMKLERDANIRDVYDHIASEGENIIGDRELKLNIGDSKPSKQLEDVWATMLFDVAQAMDHREYGSIPQAIEEAHTKFPAVTATSEMDDSNVYITLKDDTSVKYVVLPRTPNKMGAWPNV